MTAGLGPSGLTIKTEAQILAEVEATERELSNAPDLDTSADSLHGAINRAFLPRVAELWRLLGAIHGAREPAKATAAALDALCAITGTQRPTATRGRVQLTLHVAANTTIPAGAVAHVANQPSNRWVTTEAAVNASGTEADITVSAVGAVPGPFAAAEGFITVIATPVAGWLAVTNAADAAQGTAVANDAALRRLRERELSKPGTATLAAIGADLIELRDAAGEPLLLNVDVQQNASDFPDAYGRPPHCVEAIVRFRALGGTELAAARQRVAERLWRSTGGGIRLHGDHSGAVVDDAGVSQVVRWSEPVEVLVYVAATLRVDLARYAGDDAAKAAVLAYGAAVSERAGTAVVQSRVLCALIEVPGVLDVTAVTLGTNPAGMRPLNVAIRPRQWASFDTSRITIAIA